MSEGLATRIAQESRFHAGLPLPEAIVTIMDLEAMAHSLRKRPSNVSRTKDVACWDEIGFGYSIGIAIDGNAYYMFLREPGGKISMTYRYKDGSGTLAQYHRGRGVATIVPVPPDIALLEMLIEVRHASTQITSADSQSIE